MKSFSRSRTAAVVFALVMALAAGCGRATPRPGAATPTVGTPTPSAPANAVVVTHWAVTELMDPELWPHFAETFNQAGYKTASGRPIFVKPVLVSSAQQVDLLSARIGRGARVQPEIPDPTIVTPKIDHWLSLLNADLGRTVVDLSTTRDLAISWLGIATYREMAECLGWPQKEIGIADIVALRNDPRGWSSCPTAKAEWGERPLLAFTDPSSSSSARSALFALYSMAAGKPTDQLTAADVADPAVVDYMRAFQLNVDHYVADTLILQSKMYSGPRYGHFYFVEENTLVELYQGKLPVTVGSELKPQPLSREMVFIYPKEGSLAHNHPAGIVNAPWVSAEQVEGANRWIEFLREDAQQQTIMAQGFRPATRIPFADPISSRFGLDPVKPTTVMPHVNAEAVRAMVQSWDDVKKPGIVTFVVDTSGSMAGAKLEQAKKGLVQALDTISRRNQVGLVAFSDGVKERVPVASIGTNRFTIATKVDGLRATGNTHLYDAVADALQMTDAAPGGADTIRGVVVLTDGQSNGGQRGLLDLVTAMSRGEKPVRSFSGRDGVDVDGAAVSENDMLGVSIASGLGLQHPTHIFYVGIGGGDVDMQVGRILAEATGAAFQGVSEKDLAAVIEKFGKYF